MESIQALVSVLRKGAFKAIGVFAVAADAVASEAAVFVVLRKIELRQRANQQVVVDGDVCKAGQICEVLRNASAHVVAVELYLGDMLAPGTLYPELRVSAWIHAVAG